MKNLSFFQPKTIIICSILLGAFLVRFLFITKVPPSPYWEEVALGYDAYSIFKTGKDHHGNILPIVAFESFGDYKPAGYFYAIVPFIAVFGLSVFSVRIPSVIAGVVLVYVVGKIVQELMSFKGHTVKKTNILSADIFAMLVTALSPWAIQFSRGGWEANLATCLLVIGVYLGILAGKSVENDNRKKVIFYYFLSTLFFIGSTYTYHSTRVIAPLLGIVLSIPLLRRMRLYFKEILAFGVFSLLLMSPLIMDFGNPNVNQRLQETSAFSTQSEIIESNARIQQFGSTKLAKIVFHRYWFFAKTFSINLLKHFNLEYLFLRGDNNTRHSIHYFGILFPFDSILLIIGLYYIITNWKSQYNLLWLWLIIGIIPSAITKDAPHALRTLPILPVYMIVISLGLWYPLQQKWWRNSYSLIIGGIILCQFLIFGHYYLTIYPSESSKEWQYGYEQMVQAVETHKKEGEPIYITTTYKRPAMYYWFFTKTDPALVQAENSTVEKDQSEFKNFQQMKFVLNLTGQEKGLIASTPSQRASVSGATDLATIVDLEGQPIWVIYRVE